MRTESTDEMHQKTVDALVKLTACVRNMGLYGRAHTVTQHSVAVALQALSEILLSEQAFAIAVTPTYLALDSFPVEAGGVSDFNQALHKRKVGKVQFLAGVTRDEIVDFAEVLAILPEELALHGGMADELRNRNVSHILVSAGGIPTHRHEAKDPADIYEEALSLIEDAMVAVQAGFGIPVQDIRAVVEDSLSSMTADETALVALAGIRSYDKYLYEHSVNVCILCMVLGRDLGLDRLATLDLGICAMLHDVGKVFIPHDIVQKPGKLSEEEWEAIRLHSAKGARALAGLPDVPPLACTIALEHHAYLDGTGYPALSYERPHLLSRLVAIVDTYDALTTDRPYRERWTGSEAIAWMIYETSNRYDRQLLARFAARAKLYPPGSLVRLTNGDLAVVVGGSRKAPARPIIRLVTRDRKVASQTTNLADSQNSDLQIKDIAQPVEVLLPYTDLLMAA